MSYKKLREYLRRLLAPEFASKQLNGADGDCAAEVELLLSEPMVVQRYMVENLTIDDLHDLFDELGVTFASISGATKTAKVRSLLAMLTKSRQLVTLEPALRKLYPSVDWTIELREVKGEPGVENGKIVKLLVTILSKNFNLSELQSICLDLGIDYEQFVGYNLDGMAVSLVSFLAGANQLPALIARVKEARPDAPLVSDLPDSPVPLKRSSRLFIQMEDPDYQLAKRRSVALGRLMLEAFSWPELRELAFDIDFDTHDLPMESGRAFARELAHSARRRRRMVELLSACRQKHPQADWQSAWGSELPPEVVVHRQGYIVNAVRAMLLKAFVEDEELASFCRLYFPEVLYEFGTAMSIREKVQILIEFAWRKRRFEQLISSVQEKLPEDWGDGGPYRVEDIELDSRA